LSKSLSVSEYSSVLLENAVNELSRLPGIGKKTALRLALHLLREEPTKAEALAQAITQMRSRILLCERCHNISDTPVCAICANPRRDENSLCVVADLRDVLAIERTATFNGLYHVLGGVISPVEGISPTDLHIDSLIRRTYEEHFNEIILALPATIEGDTTNYYIFKQLNQFKGKVTTYLRKVLPLEMPWNMRMK